MILAFFPSAVLAQGPAARKLKSLGNNVAVPGDPPLSNNTSGKLKGDPTGPIDGGSDRPPYDIEIDIQPPLGAQKVPVPNLRGETADNSKPKSQQRKLAIPGVETENAEAEEDLACFTKLRAFAIFERTESPTADDPVCTITNPIVLKSTNGKNPVNFSDGLVLDCGFALKLAEFTSSVVQPLARHHMDKSIDTVLSGQGFVCRHRNNAPAGKLSEHAFGNATDWVGFKFEDGKRLDIKAEELVRPPQADFLNALRASACGYFTTVLGPGSNAAHATHFHFDLGRTKSGKKNPYRICE